MSSLFKKPKQDNSAQIQQQQLENQKTEARNYVNHIFGLQDVPGVMAAPILAKRRKLYDDTAGAARELNMKYLTEDRDDAQGRIKTNLYRSGLFGSSQDLEAHSNLGRKFNEGVVDIGNSTDALKRSMEADDENARLDLLDKINGGMDATSAMQAGSQRMVQNADSGIARARGRMVGDLFGGMADTYTGYQYDQGRQPMGIIQQQAPTWLQQYRAPRFKSYSGGTVKG